MMIGRSKYIFTMLIILIFSGCSNSKKITYEKAGNEFPTKKITKETKKEYLKLINQERSKGNNCGKGGYFNPVSDLSWNDNLYRSSYEHNYDMANTNTFSHYGSGTKYDWTGNKSSLKNRVNNNNYRGWKYLSENIAAGLEYKTPKEAVKAWIESDYHCVNIMNPKAKEVGMALYKKAGSEHTYYWTQNFGTR